MYILVVWLCFYHDWHQMGRGATNIDTNLKLNYSLLSIMKYKSRYIYIYIHLSSITSNDFEA